MQLTDGTLLLTASQVSTAEEHLQLPTATNLSLAERTERVAVAMIKLRARLRKESHGTRVKKTNRAEMQAAWANVERLDCCCALQSDAQPRGWLRANWLPSEYEQWYEKVLCSQAATLGWFVANLTAKQRMLASGCSSIAAKRHLVVHKLLRVSQGFEKAFNAFRESDGRFVDWTMLEFERMLVWGGWSMPNKYSLVTLVTHYSWPPQPVIIC